MNDKINFLKKLRESIGAPLNLCLKAYDNVGNDLDKAVLWLSENFNLKDFKLNKEFFLHCLLSDNRTLVQLAGSETVLRTKELNSIIESSNSLKELNDNLNYFMISTKERIDIHSSLYIQEDLKSYLHLKIGNRTCSGGIVLWKSDENISGENLHWFFDIRGLKGEIKDINKIEFKNNIINFYDIDGLKKWEEHLEKVERLIFSN